MYDVSVSHLGEIKVSLKRKLKEKLIAIMV